MGKLTRYFSKIFAGKAENNGVFGSAAIGVGQVVPTNDVDVLQSLPAYVNGWGNAIIGEYKMPPLEEIQGMQFVTSQFIKYLLQRGIAEWDANETYYVGTFCSYDGGIYFSLVDDNSGNVPPDNEDKWKAGGGAIRGKSKGGSGAPVGSIFAYAGKGIPEGYLACNGSIVSRSEYEELFVAIGTKYNTGGESSLKFRLPNLNNEGLFVQAGSSAGTKRQAGAPNITGTMVQDTYSRDWVTGCLYVNDSDVHLTATGGDTGILISVNASWSSPIYGKSTTVQPKARTVVYVISY
jgi:microcystin-dependent protein